MRFRSSDTTPRSTRSRSAPRSDAAFAYAAYTVALDREECAAGRYHTVVNQAEDLLPQGE
jgi:hypothetical protein